VLNQTYSAATYTLFVDYAVEQGAIYSYALQQFADNLYSKRIHLGTVKADFEDAFLFDGERQLKIRFNPKVSSFKTTLLESKIDTIGGKHPIFFRNGTTEYKEFPISGLISFHMDENARFFDCG